MDVERLIEEVRKFPVLYDQTSDKYRNVEYKDRIWKSIATTLEARGGGDQCKKRWASIRDQLRKTLQKRKSASGQAGGRHRKYKFEYLLKFLVPHMAERKTISNVSYSEDDEDEVDDIEYTQEDAFNVKQESTLQSNTEEEFEIENQESPIESLCNSSPSFQTSSASLCATSIRKEKLVGPGSLKRKTIDLEAKPQESVSRQLMAFILADKETEKKVKKLALERTVDDPVDAFLTGIAPSLKLLNPILLNQAKSSIFSIVQEFEMKQLMGYKDQYIEH